MALQRSTIRESFISHGPFYIFQVYIKDFFINGILKSFTPIWVDSDADIENDPYTTDCSGQSNATNPNAFTQFEIINGEQTSQICIKKQPGKPILKKFLEMLIFKYFFSLLYVGTIFRMQYNLWEWRKDQK